MSRLFNRTYSIKLGTIDIGGLRAAFDIEKSLKKEPNSALIKIWNLNEESRAQLSTPKAVDVQVDAGYGTELSQLYLGQVRGGYSEIEGPDVVTTLTTGDGDKAMQQARISIPLGPKTPDQIVLLSIAKTLGVKLGNVNVAIAKMKAGKSVFPAPTVLSGSAADAMTAFCHSAGLEWSIQDGKLLILDYGKGLDEKPYILSSDSGLIGSPSVSWDKKSGKQIVEAEILLLPGIRPGLRVVFDSRFVKGLYRLTKVNYTGDTHGTNWGARLTAESIK